MERFRDGTTESLQLLTGTEVRRSMHHVIGLLQLAAEEPLSEQQTLCVSRSRVIADELVQTVNDLAELARPDANILNPAPVLLTKALAEMADLMVTLAERKGLTFDWRVDPSVPAWIHGDRALIQDTFRRVVDSALHHTLAGSIKVSVACFHSGDTAQLVLEVTVAGKGMWPDVLKALSETANGTPLDGLPLRVARKRADELGGAMSTGSGAETTVRLALPVAVHEEPESAEEAPALVIAEHPGNLRILVAEDDDDSFLLFQTYTRDQNLAVARALDGRAAVELATTGTYDFILMDVNMPGMDGYAATRAIREWETSAGRQRCPILLCSSDDYHRQVRLGGAAGCSGYLTKPANKKQLLAAIAFYAPPPLDAPATPAN